MTSIVICANIIEKDNKFLIVKETKKIAKNLYNFPGGTLEVNETIVEAAIREAKEETGLTIKPKNLIKIVQIPKSKLGYNLIVFVFNSEIISGGLTTSEEHPKVKFASLEEIKELDKNNLLRFGSYMLDAINSYLNNESIDLSSLKFYQ